MADLTLRNLKGTPLTFDEMDSNLLALDSDSPWEVSASFITYEGNVGIGSGDWPPTYNLDFGEGTNNVATIGSRNATLEVHVDGPYPFEMFTNGVERFTVTTDGKVGINEPNPAQPLDVVGNIQTTTTFIGNQAYCNSFYDGTLTISSGTIYNADGGNFSGRIRFGSLRDDDGVAITRFETELTDTDTKLPTSGAVFSFVNEQVGNADSDIQVKLDSAYAWNQQEHQDIRDSLNAEIVARTNADSDLLARINADYAWNQQEHQDIRDSFDARMDSEHAWNVAEHQSLSDSLTLEIVARTNADSDLLARINTDYAWNVSEHTAIRDSLNNEITAREDADSDINARIDNLNSDFDSALDSEHAWNVAEHQALSDSLTTEIIARTNADSDLLSRINTDYAWNVSEHTAIRDSLNNEIEARANADSDLLARIDTDYAWNQQEHQEIRDSLNTEIVARKDADSDLGVRIDNLNSDLDSALDSEHTWNVAEHQSLSDSLTTEIINRTNDDSDINVRIDNLSSDLDSALDSEHAWNVEQHDSLHTLIVNESIIRHAVDSALGMRLDSDYDWNVAEHQALSDSITAEALARSNADSDLLARIDTDYAWNVAEHTAIRDSLNTEITARSNADSDLGVRIDNLNSDIDSSLDSEHAWNVSEHNILQSQFDNLTTDSVSEASNLYYTNARVDARNDSTIDSNFLNNRMPLTNLSDVQINTPTLTNDDVLQWNGSVWSNQSIGIAGTIQFRGGVDATTENAPAVKENGDFYVNSTSGTALGTWTGLTQVDSGDGLAWDSDATTWRNLGKITQGSVVRVRPGTAVSVDETDPARPTVAVDKTITDTWYVEIADHNSDIQALKDSLAAEITARENGDTALGNRLDSEHTWNITQHLELSNANSDLSATVDNNYDYFNSVTNQLQINIDNLDSRLDSELTVIDAKFDSLALSISGDISVEIDGIQVNLDSIEDRLDSEHTWNVAQHLELSNANSDLSVAVDSNYDYFNSVTNQLQININQIDSRLDSELTVIDGKLDSLALSISGDINVEIDGIQVNLDSIEDRIDSEHAWNVAEHLKLSNANSDLTVAVDSNFEYFNSITNQLEININQLDSRLDSELAIIDDKFDSLALSISGDINVEINNIQSNIDSIEDRLDSEHTWNVAEHLKLSNANSDLTVAVDSNYDYFNSVTNQLQININNIDSRLDSELAIIDDKLDSLSLSIGGEINVEINQIQSNIDSIEDRLDSEHTWNVAQHLELSNANSDLTVAVDSNFEYFTSITNQLEININNIDSRLDSELAIIDDKLDSLSLSIGGEINVEINNLQDQIDNITTDSVAEGINNLYYTDSRVENKILSTVDSDYVMERVTIESALRFKGATSVDVYNAPDSKQNGDIYINDSDAVANNTWIGIEGETILEAQSVGWSEDLSRWYVLGGIADPEIHDSDFVQARQQYVTLDSSAPTAPFTGEMWLDRNDDVVKLYDGSVWFEFPAGAAGGGTTLVIDSDEPTGAIEGDLWLDKNVDIVKVYDGSVWFEFPAGSSGGAVSNSEIISIVDSALDAGQILLDASPTGGASDDF